MEYISRKEFISKAGLSAAALLAPVCLGGLMSCSEDSVTPQSGIDFTVDISTGSLASNGGSLVKNGIIIARTSTGDFLAVSAACTHEGATVNFVSSNSTFLCPRHGAKFSSTGSVISGPTNKNLAKYNTSVNGTTLRVFA